MSRYVITITPDNGGGTGADTAHTTVRVDTSTGQTRITELTVRAASGGGLAPADLPPVDLDLLVRALTGPMPAQALPPTAAAAEPEAAEEATVVAPAAPAPRRRARKAATRARKATAAKKTAAKKATAQKATGTRAYRRMPEPEEVMDAYRRTGSITAVAEHFDVPRHTVAGWARRLRGLGYAIGRQ
ncbi:helix-turn-helix domain-containing protein [Phytohabitans rumicis]|uniref:Uncharacterized protein n=1 Tax=Phytohabitans rumicis TaxID=1076125 RepID=A0A6V8L1X7_9ACTN|nr:helix-turn-helix domain-containing protein [Phytohabitans rumicis]GFJ88801.1 hypothetical protein Prum_024430 [Phytohabitans rumicis]